MEVLRELARSGACPSAGTLLTIPDVVSTPKVFLCSSGGHTRLVVRGKLTVAPDVAPPPPRAPPPPPVPFDPPSSPAISLDSISDEVSLELRALNLAGTCSSQDVELPAGAVAEASDVTWCASGGHATLRVQGRLCVAPLPPVPPQGPPPRAPPTGPADPLAPSAPASPSWDRCPLSACDHENCSQNLELWQIAMLLGITFFAPLCLCAMVCTKPLDGISEARINGCMRSGMLAIVFVFMCAINITMYLLLREEFPCATGLGSCSTISCISANVYAEGCALEPNDHSVIYVGTRDVPQCACVADVFMFCCLLLTAFALVIEIWKRMRHTEYFWSRTLLISGALLVSLTGVFPAREARDNSVEQTTLEAGGRIHTAGIGLGVMVMVHVPEYVSAHHRLTSGTPSQNLPREEGKGEKGRRECMHVMKAILYSLLPGVGTMKAILYSLLPGVGTDGAELLYSLCLWGLMGSFLVLHVQEGHSTSNYCAGIADDGNLSRACDLWPQLDNQTCEALISDGLVRPRYRRGFVPGVWEDSGWNQIDPEHPISGGYCVKKVCRLWESTLGVALEFAVLLLALCKFILIGVHKIESQALREDRAAAVPKPAAAQPAAAAESTASEPAAAAQPAAAQSAAAATGPSSPHRASSKTVSFKGLVVPALDAHCIMWFLFILTAFCSLASLGSSTANFEHASNHTEVQATMGQEVRVFLWTEIVAYVSEATLTCCVLKSCDSFKELSNKLCSKCCSIKELFKIFPTLFDKRRYYLLELAACGLGFGLAAETFILGTAFTNEAIFEEHQWRAMAASWIARVVVQFLDYCLLIVLVFMQHAPSKSSNKLWMFRIMAMSSMCWLFLNQLMACVLPAFEMQTWYASRSDGWPAPLVGYTAFRFRLISFFLHRALHETDPYPGFKPENILCHFVKASVQVFEMDDGGSAGETAAVASPGEWSIDAATASKFRQMFADACAAAGPDTHSLGKQQAGCVLHQQYINHGLPVEVLLQIWALADVRGNDQLDLRGFMIWCFLAELSVQKNPTRTSRLLASLPASLPPELLESAESATATVSALAAGPQPTVEPTAEARSAKSGSDESRL